MADAEQVERVKVCPGNERGVRLYVWPPGRSESRNRGGTHICVLPSASLAFGVRMLYLWITDCEFWGRSLQQLRQKMPN